MNFQIQSTFVILLMALISQNDGMGMARAFDLKQCTRSCKMRRWAPKLVKKCIKNCKKADKKNRQNNENSNDSLSPGGKRRQLGNVFEKPINNSNGCIEKCELRRWAPQKKERCIKMCDRQNTNNNNRDGEGSNSENDENNQQSRYRCKSNCKRRKIGQQKMKRCLKKCG
mmetsp:Transcript_15530/g.31546  ORF Transcript_15530/g.31546 Transcript_15530/m.31546 type:complete len:170 (+) Transcript_15530:66-575(+)